MIANPRPRPFAACMSGLPERFKPRPEDHHRIRVHVATTGPEPGNWLIAVDGKECSVFEGSIAQPHARIYTDSEIGAAVLSGRETLDAALAGGLLDYDGDLEVLRHLATGLGLGELR